MGRLSTHVLDTMHGRPAPQLLIELFSIEGDTRRLLKRVRTNTDGRTDTPLLDSDTFEQGIYELVFHAGDYFSALGLALPQPRFVDQVAVRFGVANPDENYHVPLLVTPWTWSTYRGS